MAKHAFTGEVIGKPGAERREMAAFARAAAAEHERSGNERRDLGEARWKERFDTALEAVVRSGIRSPRFVAVNAAETFADRDPEVRSHFDAASKCYDEARERRWEARKHSFVATIQTWAAKMACRKVVL